MHNRWIQKLFYSYLTMVLLVSANNCYAFDSRQVAVKAAYLFRMALFVQWPIELPNNMLFCIAKDKQYTQVITDILLGKQINQQSIQIITVDNPSHLEQCQVLYIPKTVQQVDDFLRISREYAILTVGETKYFYQHQGMIYLYPVANKLRFAINHQSAEQSGLKINIQLLQLAQEPD